MKCLNCGFEFEEGIFCPECGVRYENEVNNDLTLNTENISGVKAEQGNKELLLPEELDKKAQLELAKVQVEQERLAKERAEHEAEILRLQNEKMRLEQEQKKQDEKTRTYNGHVYSSVEDMESAKIMHENEKIMKKEQQKANVMAFLCMILGIATYPLIYTLILWLPSIVLSIVLGIKAINYKTNKWGFLKVGFLCDASFVVLLILSGLGILK